MPILTIRRGETVKTVEFSGKTPLSVLLDRAGESQAQPCGGRGVCGKCAVELTGEVSPPNAQETALGKRLSCQAEVWGDAEAVLPKRTGSWEIETAAAYTGALRPMGGVLGLAVDIGTTTLAAQLYDLKTGKRLSEAARLNPQGVVAADVMGRIGAALDGKLTTLRDQVQDAIRELLRETCQKAARPEEDADVLLLTGNTVMLYLLTGRDPISLSRAPFLADTLFGTETELLGRRAYLPLCMNAFVGADITCAVLASGMCEREETSLLCDIGTNGEIALWHRGTLYVTSTAAGPAFEGAGISCGCGSAAGAIDRVWEEDGAVRFHTIGGAEPIGICGSGLIDATAVFLDREDISCTGAIDPEGLPLGNLRLLPGDIRAVQLAKAAIASGIRLLLRQAGITAADVSRFWIAGGFGNHLNLQSAAAIGLIPETLVPKARPLGNAALSGAAALLLDREQVEKTRKIVEKSQHVNLSGNPSFNDVYVSCMLFGDDDLDEIEE